MHILVLIFFAAYLWTAAPSLTWFDTGELATGAFTLGNGHPPGQPLYALAGKGASLLPLASVPFRLTLLSALCSALVVALSPRLLERLSTATGRAGPHPVSPLLLASLVGLALPVWLQAVRIEVYALHLLLATVMLLLALEQYVRRPTHPATLLWVAMITGAALANHHLLIVLALPGIAMLVGWPGLRRLAWAIAATGMGLAIYLQAPIRSRAGAILDWGRPDAWSRWWAVVTGRAYQRSFTRLTLEQLASNLETHALLVWALMGPVVLALAAIGFTRLLSRPRVAAALALLISGNIAATALQSVFSPENPDALGYLSLSFLLIGLLAATGFDAVARTTLEAAGKLNLSRTTQAVTLALAASAVGIVPVLRAWPRPDLANDWTCFRFSRSLMTTQPAGTLYFSGSDATTFTNWYQQVIEGARPDISSLPLYTLPDPGPVRLGPPLTGLSGEGATGPVPVVRRLVAQELPRREVLMNANDLPLELIDRLRVTPTSFRVAPELERSPLDAGLDEVLEYWTQEARRLAADPAFLRDRQARLIYPAHLEAIGDHFRELGLLADALRAFRLAQTLDPDGTRLVRLKRARLEQRMEEIKSRYAGPLSPDGPASEAQWLERAHYALDLGLRDSARELLRGLSGEAPALLLARARLARQEGDLEAVTLALTRLRAVAPQSPEAATALAEMQQLLPAPEAESWLTQLLEHRREPHLAAALALRLRARGVLPEAAQLLDAALAGFPDSLELHVARGWTWLDQDEPRRALGEAQTALRIDPVDPRALKLSSFLYRQGLL